MGKLQSESMKHRAHREIYKVQSVGLITVDLVAQKWITNIRKVDSDLMSTTTMNDATNQGNRTSGFAKKLQVGMGGFSVFTNGHFVTVVLISADRKFNGP